MLPADAPVGRREIVVVASGLGCLVEQPARLIVGGRTPATGRECQDSEADFRYLEFGFPHGPIVHHAVPPRPQRGRGYLTATPGSLAPGNVEERREPDQLRTVEYEHRDRVAAGAGPSAHGQVEVDRREVLDQEQGGEDDEAG